MVKDRIQAMNYWLTSEGGIEGNRMSDVLPEKQLMGRRWELSRRIRLLDSIRLMFFYQDYFYKDIMRIYFDIYIYIDEVLSINNTSHNSLST